MSGVANGTGWWQASDGGWYQSATPPAPGWWLAADRRWYPPQQPGPQPPQAGAQPSASRPAPWEAGQPSWGTRAPVAVPAAKTKSGCGKAALIGFVGLVVVLLGLAGVIAVFGDDSSDVSVAAPVQCDPGQVLSEVSVRIDGDALLVDWAATRPLDSAEHSFVVTIDGRLQVGVKQVGGAAPTAYAFDMATITNREIEGGQTDGSAAAIRVPLSELGGISAESQWRAAATEQGADVGACPSQPAPIR